MTDADKYFPVGTSEFDEIIEEEALFVDKTLFIKEFMNNLSKVSIILRPRRFGKSTNLSMLKSFLSLVLDQRPSRNLPSSKILNF